MNVLLTGASGFIGAHLARRLSSTLPGLRTTTRAEWDLSTRATFDVPADVVIHAAARVKAAEHTAEDYRRDNVDAVRNLLSWAKHHDVKRLIFLSSVSVYGRIDAPIVTEETAVVSADAYGATKHEAELLIASEASWLGSVALRLPGVLGAGATGPWLARARAALVAGQPVTIENADAPFNNMVHVDELAELVGHLAVDDTLRGFEAVTLGCREPLTVRGTVELLRERLGSTSRIDVRAVASSRPFAIATAKAERLGFRPSTARSILSRFAAGY